MTIYDDIKQPKVVFETHSEFNNDIKVIDTGKILKLQIDGELQSVSRHSQSASNRVWGTVLNILADNSVVELKNILVLGLGGGTMQHLISKKFTDVSIVSVEIDEVIVDVSRKYFHLDEIPNHKVVIGDACRVIVEPHEFGLAFQTFSAVVVDIFLGSVYPDLGNSGNFFAHLKRMCVPNGLIIINRIYREDHQEDVDNFIENAEEFISDIDTTVIAGKTNADNILIFGHA